MIGRNDVFVLWDAPKPDFEDLKRVAKEIKEKMEPTVVGLKQTRPVKFSTNHYGSGPTELIPGPIEHFLVFSHSNGTLTEVNVAEELFNQYALKFNEKADAMKQLDDVAQLSDAERLKNVAQILIEELGSVGPENAEDAAQRAVEWIKTAKVNVCTKCRTMLQEVFEE